MNININVVRGPEHVFFIDPEPFSTPSPSYPSEQFESSRISIADVGGLSSQLDRRRRLTTALHRLPVDQQIAFELRFGEELSLAEVAEAMEVSLATVKRYLKKARESLQAILSEPEFAAAGASEARVVDAYRSE